VDGKVVSRRQHDLATPNCSGSGRREFRAVRAALPRSIKSRRKPGAARERWATRT